MNEISTNKALFDKLYKALEKAASDEASQRRMISNEDYDAVVTICGTQGI